MVDKKNDVGAALMRPERVRAFDDIFSYGIDSREQFLMMSLADHLRRSYDFTGPVAARLFTEVDKVIDDLEFPKPITRIELVLLAISHLAGADLSAGCAAPAYSRFVDVTRAALEMPKATGTTYVLGGGWKAPTGKSDQSKMVWRSANGIFLEATAEYSPDDDSVVIWGEFNGKCTERARADLEQQLEPVLNSIARTVHICGGERATADWLLEGGGQLLYAGCVSTCLPDWDQDGLQIHVRTAINEVATADAAPPSLRFERHMGAVETLVCGSETNVPHPTMAERIATLLVADARKRAKRAPLAEWLCAMRTGVFSAQDSAVIGRAGRYTRRMVAGLIDAAVCWVLYRELIGQGTSWHEFIAAVDAASCDGSVVPGLSDASALMPGKLFV